VPNKPTKTLHFFTTQQHVVCTPQKICKRLEKINMRMVYSIKLVLQSTVHGNRVHCA